MLAAERIVRRYVLEESGRLAKAEGRVPTFVQIGANDGVTDDPLTKFITEEGWKGILVEPIASAFANLKANYAGVPDLRFVNAAVSEKDGKATIFTSANSRMASLDKGHASRGGKDDIQGEEVTLLSPRTLFEMHGLSRVDALVIDAEGFDGRILRAIDFRSFTASVIVWESHNLGPDGAATTDYLRREGYSVVAMHADSVAVRRDLFRFDDHLAGALERMVAHDVKSSREMRQLRKSLETGVGGERSRPVRRAPKT